MNNWKMYAKIQDLKNKKFKKTQVARKLGINRETVAKYLDMPPDAFAVKSKYTRACKGHLSFTRAATFQKRPSEKINHILVHTVKEFILTNQ